jgi:hypothetical protein
VLVYDRAGNSAPSVIAGFTVYLGPPPPPGPIGISINHGDYATNSPQVELDLVWPQGASEALLSNDGGFNAPGETASFALALRLKWTLRSEGNERLPKTVYLRFPNSPNAASTYSDDIIVDTTAPVIESAKLLTPGSGKPAAAPGGSSSFRIRLKARETLSGISAAQFAPKRSAGTIVTFRPRTQQGLLHLSLVVTLGPQSSSSATRASLLDPFTPSLIKPRPPRRPQWVRVESAAGTWSAWRRLT